MKRIVAVILLELVFHTVETEPGVADAVAIAADQRSEVRPWIRQVTGERVEAKHHVGHSAFAVRRSQRYDDAAIVGDSCLDAVLIGQSKKLDGSPIGHLAEIGLRCLGCCRHRRCSRGQDEKS